jgi:hypothetical protein
MKPKPTPEQQIDVQVWTAAVRDAESDVNRETTCPCGGWPEKSTAEERVAINRKRQDNALARLAHARKRLAEAEGKS